MSIVYGVFAMNQDGLPPSLCFNELGKPEIYADASDAELSASKWREARPDYKFAVTPMQVL